MPVRDVDTFGETLPPHTHCIANRGANGIDGLIATTLGTAVATAQPTVALLGDVATLHDASALLAAQELTRHLPNANLTLIVVNNNGGGIFNFLPVKAHQDNVNPKLPFERLFNTPQHIDFGALALAYGLNYERVHTTRDFDDALPRTLSHPGIKLLEVVVEVSKQDNVALHNAHHERVAHALDEVLV
jgi:2-succinyl-5-enolpyruvyl-6-hydroxy-3-cyclohexene-1-carboxylate synthase